MSSSSQLLVVIANVKAKLGVNDLEGDKPVPQELRSSFAGFKQFILEQGGADAFATDLCIIDRAWDRSSRGRKLSTVSDLCWCLMNSANSSLISERRTSVETATVGDVSVSASASPKVVISRQDIESTSLVQFYKSLLHRGDEGTDFKDGTIFSDAEWSTFVDSLCSPLPMTFRLHRQGSYKSECANILLTKDEEFSRIIRPLFPQRADNFVNASNNASPPPSTSLPVYGCSNQTYRSATREQDICRTGHSGGLWSFQEFVSMLPVASLQIQPHHAVFDMCAAPGSKSIQALDALNGQQLFSSSSPSSSSTFLKNGGGCIVCNEKQPAKARQMLPARMKRYCALQNIVLCSDATKLPWFVQANKLAPATAGDAVDPRFYFDRIICDVPCCGDGTVRKDRSIFGTWNIDYVTQLADTQLHIARRAAGMLKIGGRMAYSTCSMNPIEDEHVIFQLMCMMNGNTRARDSADNRRQQLELIDVNEVLLLGRDCGIELKSRGGIDLGRFSANADGEQQRSTTVPPSSPSFSWSLEKLIAKIPENFRPASMDEAKSLASEIAKKVLRVFPHRDNTGGFFVALLEKKDNLPNILPNPKKFQILSNRKRFELVHPNDDEWKSTMEWFGLENRWRAVFSSTSADSPLPQPHVLLYPPPLPASASPLPCGDHLYQQPMIPFWCVGINNPLQKKRIHLTTVSAAAIVFNSQLAGGSVELVNFGVRLFERMPDKYLNLTVSQRLRIASEAADLVQPEKRVWSLTANNNSNNNSDDRNVQETQFVEGILLRGYAQIELPSLSSQPSSVDHASVSSSTVVMKCPPALLQAKQPLQHQPGSFVFCFNFSSTCQVWLGAMLTPLGKIDLFADGAVRRMLLQVHFGIALESSRVEAHRGGITRRRERNPETGGGGGDDGDGDVDEVGDDDDAGAVDDQGHDEEDF